MKKFLFTLLFFPMIVLSNHKIDSLESALSMASGETKYTLLHELSVSYWTIDPEISEKYAQEALNFAKKSKDKKMLAESYKNLGSAFLFQNKIGDAHKNYLVALNFYEDLHDDEGISKISNNIGYSYYRLDKYDKSLEYYFKAIEIDKKHGNKEEHITTLQNVANTYFKLEDYDQALSYYFKCMEYYKNVNDQISLIEIYNNLGSLYTKTHEYYKALEYLNRAKNLADEIDNTEQYAKIHNNLGDIYYFLQEYSEALDLYLQSLSYSQQIKDKWSIANTSNNIGKVYLITNQADSAKKYLYKALEIAQIIQSSEIILESYKDLSLFYEKAGNFEQALTYHKQYFNINDSVFNFQKSIQISNLQALYDISEKDNQLKIMQQKSQIKNYVIYAFGSISLLIILFIILIYLRYKSGVNIRNKLKEKNNKISEQNILLEKTLTGLKESEEKYKSLIKHMHEGLVVLQNKNIIFINEAFSDITGLGEKELLNKPLNSLVAEKDVKKIEKFTTQLKKDGIIKTIDIQLMVKKESKYVNATFGTITFNGQQAIMGTIIDINEQKKYEQKLINEQQNALQAKESRTMLLASISHEIKNHLQGLTGMTEIFTQQKLNDDQVKFLKTIDASGQSILSILEDVLDYSKIEAGQIKLKKETFSIHNLIEEVSLLFEKNIHAKGINYQTIIDNKIPDRLIGDMQRLKQVLVNLLSNANKFTEKGEIILRVKLSKLDEQKDKCTLVFELSDTGPGIPDHQKTIIFSPFSQTDVRQLTIKQGTGLGLAISKNLVRLFNGTLHVKDNDKGGAVFWFTLQFDLPVSDKDHQLKNKANLSILTVDDDAFNLNYILKILGKRNFTIETAINGKEGYEKYMLNPCDIVLMDIQMPVMDGFESTRLIRQFESDNNLKKSKIIAVTAFANEGKNAQFIEAGMDGFLEKPFVSEDLLKFIVPSSTST